MKKNQPSSFSSFFLLLLSLCVWSCGPSSGTAQQSNERKVYEKALEEFGLSERMEHYGVPGLSVATIKEGKVDWSRGYGVIKAGQPERVNSNTMFSVGSVSKVGTAVMVLKLQEEGLVDIDTDVNQYLTSWKIPENKFTKEQAVTLRRIMSHTAGLTVHGFADFLPHEELPTSVQILTGEPPAKNNRVYVDIPVGSRFRYSGGGTQVEQLLVEDLLGESFHKAVESRLFQPLGMKRSSYENPLPEQLGNIAKAHNRRGKPVALPRGYQSMPEAAASGLWTTPTDFAQLMIMLMEVHQGTNTYLSQETVTDMMSPVSPSQYGLGPQISKESGDIRFTHGGANDSYRARFIGSLNKRSGLVIFTNGSAGSDLISELVRVFEPLVFD